DKPTGGSAFNISKPDAGDKKSTRWESARVEDNFAGVSVSFEEVSGDSTQLLPVEESPYGDEEDTGQCLSMHQPWASFLVLGFKRAEGRGWKSEHRGRLWIHAAAKPPDEFEVESLEMRYRSLYEACGIPIPLMPSENGGYPTSALLGCVDMEACWTNEEYTRHLASHPSMPQEESDCDLVFWCLRPRRLVVPLKMGGDHKIWRIEKHALAAARRGLQHVRWPAPVGDQNRLVSPHIEPRGELAGPVTSGALESDAAAATGSKARPASSSDARFAKEAPPRLDLWPREAPELLQVLTRDRDSVDRNAVVLQGGFVHLVGFVPADLQQRVVDEIREFGVLPSSGFAAEHFDGIKVSEGVLRMYLGMHWNSDSRRWESELGNSEKPLVAPLPKLLADMYSEALKSANREMASGQNKKRKLIPFPEDGAATTCVAEFCPSSSSVQLHQEKTESRGSIEAGYPIMGICIGESFELSYSSEGPASSQKPKVVRFASGDVFLMGGESRLLWHGVSRIIPRTMPPSLRLIPGLLNLSLRVH
ncbi:unnamed protein product, partial [Polarella glacialis]